MCIMSNTVTVKCGEHYYKVPMHEYSRYWLDHLDKVTIPYLPNDIPKVSVLAAYERAAKEGDSWD